MAATHNGWSTITSGGCTYITAGGKSTRVKSGDVATVLSDVANQFNSKVEAIATFHGWRSVATNTAAGGIRTSNHLSGTAIDINGGKYPMGKKYMSAAKIAAIRTILSRYSGIITWGGDFPSLYGSKVDQMHFEIKKGTSVAQVASVAAALRGGSTPTGKAAVIATQNAVRANPDGIWGPDTDHRVNLVRVAINKAWADKAQIIAIQQVIGTKQDGIWGKNSQAALGATIGKLQRAWGTPADNIWGKNTEAAYVACRSANKRKDLV